MENSLEDFSFQELPPGFPLCTNEDDEKGKLWAGDECVLMPGNVNWSSQQILERGLDRETKEEPMSYIGIPRSRAWIKFQGHKIDWGSVLQEEKHF